MIEADDPICVSAALLLRFPGKDIIKERQARYSCVYATLISWRILQKRPQLRPLLPGDLAATDLRYSTRPAWSAFGRCPYMDFELTDEQELIRSAVREFAESELAPVAAEIDRDHRFPREVVPKMAALNLMGMPYPEEVGGAGADYVSYVIAVEEVSRACATTAVIMMANSSLATWPIFKFGTQAQKDKYLHDMASGRRLGAFALTEPAGNRCRRGHRHGGAEGG